MTTFSTSAALRRVEPETVQVTDGRGSDVPRQPWESAGIFAVFAVAYVAFGEWLIRGLHVIGFDALDRFDRALMVWHNNPGKLSALGFDIPPLNSLVLLPLTIVPSWVSSLAVVPLASAIPAAWLMVVLNTVMRRTAITLGMRYVILLALGANPLFALYASDGYRDLLGLALLATGISAVIAWYITADVRFVLVAGLVFAVAAMASYDTLLWFVGCVAIIGAVLVGQHAGGDETEGTTIGLAVPVVYTVCLWVMFNLILNHHPFGWLPIQHGAAAVPFGTLLSGTGQIILYGAPIAIVVLPALLVLGIRNGDGFARWLALLLAIACVEPALAAALHLTSSPLTLRGAVPILVISVMGAAWLCRGNGPLVSVLLIVVLVVSIPWTYTAMGRVHRQNLEAVFTHALSTGTTQDGVLTPGGSVVGISRERDMARWITAHVSGEGRVLTDNAQTYGVILMSGRPQLFYDRIDRSDGPWKKAAVHPGGRISYLLFSRNNPHDLLAQVQPKAAAGQDTALPVVYANQRYLLVRVGDHAAHRNRPMTMTDPAITPAPDLDAILAAGADARLGRMSFMRPRVAHRRGAPPVTIDQSGEEVRFDELLRAEDDDRMEPLTVVDEDAEARAEDVDAEEAHAEEGPDEMTVAAETVEEPVDEPVDEPVEEADVPAHPPVEAPASVMMPVLHRMRAVHLARQRVRDVEEEQLVRHRELATAEAELEAELVRLRGRLESLALLAPATDSSLAGFDEMGEVIALLHSQAG